MKTTQLIDLLKKYECGAVTGRPREVFFEVGDDEIIGTDGIEMVGAGDGLATDLLLSLPTIEPPTTTWLGSYSPYQCKHCGKHTDSKTPFCAWCGRRASNYD